MTIDTARQPQRIQRQRTWGWRLPEGAVCVTQETPFGNPFRIGDPNPGCFLDEAFTRETAIEAYREWLLFKTYPSGWKGRLPATAERVRLELRGKDLACWCSLDEACHADVLLEVANS